MKDFLPNEIIEVRQQRMELPQPPLPKDISALRLLQMEYRGEIELTPNQRRAAIACLQFESPKLGAVAVAMNGSFAEELDRLIMKRTGKLIEHHPDEGEGKSPSPLPAQAHWPIRRSVKSSRRF
jgi:hypothetical protein